MAVSNLVVKQDYVGNGATTTFAIPFAFIKPDQIKVYLLDTVTGSATLQVISTNYTYNNPTNPTSIVMNVAPAAGKWLRVIRVTAINQDTEIENNGEFLEEEMETALDKLTLMMQEVSDRMASAIVLSPVDSVISNVLPPISANAVLGSSPDGLSYVWRAAADFVGPQGEQGEKGDKGDTGATGATGATGETGYGIFFDMGAPSNGFGNDNDVYVDEQNFNIYYKITGAWALKGNLKGPKGDTGNTGPQGPPGDKGDDGVDGNDGADGEAGSQIYSNYGAPLDSLGKDTDLYVDRNAPFNYYYKLSGSWVLQNSLQGLQGPPGADGAIGPTAFGLFIDTGVPDNAFGNDNDIWIDNTTFDLYYKITGAWVVQGSLRPPGFPAGGTAGQVIRKIDGTDYNTEWHTLVKGDVGLGNVDNTSDANKPVSTATQTALDLKADQADLDTTDTNVSGLALRMNTAEDDIDALEAGKQDSLGAGTLGQHLVWGVGGPAWDDQDPALPPGGTAGQLLTKNSGTDGDASWQDPPVTLPSQTGNAGKILETDGTSASWVDKPKTVVSATQTLTGGGTITRIGGRSERVKVGGTGGETSVTIAASPTPMDGDELFIKGMDDANPVIVGPFVLTAGLVAHLMWDAGTSTWDKVGGV